MSSQLSNIGRFIICFKCFSQLQGCKNNSFRIGNEIFYKLWVLSVNANSLIQIKVALGAFDRLHSGIGINRIKTWFNLIGHNSCQVRRTPQLNCISRPSHYL